MQDDDASGGAGDEPTRMRGSGSRQGKRAADVPAVPARLGAYVVRRELGRGGMGVVYEALDEKLGRAVALKSVPLALALDADARQQLAREARALAAVNHPNVATIHGLEEHDGRHYLVLELVEGVTLARRLEQGALPLVEAMQACAQVAAGLAAAHENGVVHGDLKPGNVMITRRGVSKVLDFGLARRGGAPSEAGRGLVDGADGSSIFGTPGYMSPEQIRDGIVDERTDAWAFGCVLFECLTGRFAMPGDTGEDRLAATLARAPDLASLPAGIPDELRDLVRRCLEGDPTRRLRDLTEAERALDEMLAREAPSAAASGRRERFAGNLPSFPTTFVGREGEAAELIRLVDERPLVTLTGPAGCGKTRLALHAAARLRTTRRDGAWLVELAPVATGAGVARQFAAGLALPADGGATPEAALAGWLASRSPLVILDNCEHLLAECARLVRVLLLASPGLRIVATSREALGVPGETTLAVASLPLPESGEADPQLLLRNECVRLFLDRARLAAPGFELTGANAPHVVSACRRLDGIPLAIELAAARLKHLSVDQLVKRLDDRFRVLADGSRALPRQQTLRAAIDWSHDLLSVDEAVVYRRLAAFRGGFLLDAAERVASGGDVHVEDVLDHVAHLVDKSLVTLDSAVATPRYRMLESIRQHAREKLDASAEAASVRARHRSAVLELLRSRPREGGRGDADWYARVAAEHDNLAEALETCAADPAGAADAMRIAAEAWPYWMSRGHLHEGRAACESALARANEAQGEPRAPVLAGAAVLAARLGDSARAIAQSEEALSLHRDAGDVLGEALDLRNLGRIAIDQARAGDASARLTESLTLSRAAGDGRGMATTVRLLALVAELEGDRARELALTEESLVLSMAQDDRLGVAQSHNNLGLLLRETGDPARARTHLEQCLAIAEEAAVTDMVATALNNLGLVACDEGRHEEARALVLRGLKLRADLRDDRHLASSLIALGLAEALAGGAPRAAWLLGAGDALRARLGIANDLRSDQERAASLARRDLGEDAFDRALVAGGASPLARTIESALGDAGRGAPSGASRPER